MLVFLGLNNVFCVYTEVMAQDDTVTLNKTTPHFQLLPISKVAQSLLHVHEVPKKSYNRLMQTVWTHIRHFP